MTAQPTWGRRSTDRPEHRARLLEIKRQNLERLELQAAQHSSFDVPLDLQNEMEQLRTDIAALEAAAQPAGPSDDTIDTLGPIGQYRVMYAAIMGLQADFVEVRNEVYTQRWVGAVVMVVCIVVLVVVAVWR